MYLPELIQKKSEELQKIRLKYQCEHSSKQITKRVLTNGVVQYVFQCLTCGKACSKAIKKDEVLKIDNSLIADFNEKLLSLNNNHYRNKVDQIEEKYKLLQKRDLVKRLAEISFPNSKNKEHII